MIKKIDHFVITTAQAKACLDFYKKLGFQVSNAGNRYELRAGDFKINVHLLGHEIEPHAQHVQAGSADLCFEVDQPISDYYADLQAQGLHSFSGIVERHGVHGTMQSIYLRDPDQNLIELSSYR